METFEFLSSFEEWEQECLHNPPNIDRLPIQGQDGWTFPAQIMSTLRGYGKAEGNLDDIVKNGGRKKDYGVQIDGFPGLLGKGALKITSKELEGWVKLTRPTPEQLHGLPDDSFLIQVRLQLLTPFFSKDDTAFYPTENVLRRDWVFDAPFLSAASIKGLLRWAHLISSGKTEDDDDANLLFGTVNDTPQAKGELNNDSSRGILYTFPLYWEDAQIGMDIINPQNRDTGSGTVPVKYEVVKPKAHATFSLLLVNPAWRGKKNGFSLEKILPVVLRDLDFLFSYGGLSAKKTSDWGSVKTISANASVKGRSYTPSAPQTVSYADKSIEEAWNAFEDAEGKLLPYDEKVFTGKRLKAILTDWSNKQLKDRDAAYAAIQTLYEKRHPSGQSSDSDQEECSWIWPSDKGTKFDTLKNELLTMLKESKA